MEVPQLQGVITPIITPFKDGEVDYAAFDHLVKWQADEGVAGLVLNTLVGEGPTLSAVERRSLISRAVSLHRGHGVVIVATGTCSTQTTICRTEEARQLGADFALIVQPYYSRPTQKGIIQHFEQVAAAVDLPIILDDDPQHAGVALKDETVEAIEKIATIAGILEPVEGLAPASALTPSLFARTLRLTGSGDAMRRTGLTSRCLVSASANVVPDIVVSLYQAILDGDLSASKAQCDRIGELILLLGEGSEPALLKQAVSFLRGISPKVRLPLTPASADEARSIARALRAVRWRMSPPCVHPLVQEARSVRIMPDGVPLS